MRWWFRPQDGHPLAKVIRIRGLRDAGSSRFGVDKILSHLLWPIRSISVQFWLFLAIFGHFQTISEFLRFSGFIASDSVSGEAMVKKAWMRCQTLARGRGGYCESRQGLWAPWVSRDFRNVNRPKLDSLTVLATAQKNQKHFWIFLSILYFKLICIFIIILAPAIYLKHR